MATRDEDKSTRGRANILREFFYNNEKENPFDSKEIYDILDLCISCKACKSECPSNVDMAKLKAEFLQNYYDIHGIPLRSKLVAYLPRLNRLAMVFRPTFKFCDEYFFTEKIHRIFNQTKRSETFKNYPEPLGWKRDSTSRKKKPKAQFICSMMSLPITMKVISE